MKALVPPIQAEPYVYLSIGSNVGPISHIAFGLEQLARRLGSIYVLQPRRTTPVAMSSPHDFVNTLAICLCDWEAFALKQWLEEIETQSGRDRNHPQSSTQDRTLDIDVLARSHICSVDQLQCAEAPYDRAVVAEMGPAVDIPLSPGAAVDAHGHVSWHGGSLVFERGVLDPQRLGSK